MPVGEGGRWGRCGQMEHACFRCCLQVANLFPSPAPPNNVLLCVRVCVRAAHPHENVPGGVGVASNPSPIALSKGASLSSADPFSHGRQIERSSDPHRGQGHGVSLNDTPHRPDPFDSCLGARLPTGIPSTGNSLASSSLRKVLLWEVPPCNFNGSR